MAKLFGNLGKSEKEQQQEMLSAYLDNALPSAERARFEQQLALDDGLQDELTEMRMWQRQMRSLPARRVPRNFTLDPALYGRPQRRPLASAYPLLRMATAFTAVLLVIALAANMFLDDIVSDAAQFAAQEAVSSAPAPEMAAGEAAPQEEMMREQAAPTAQPAETFMLEESAVMEADEVPVEIVEPQEALPENPQEAVTSADDQAAGSEELLTEKPLEISPALEILEETAQPSAARDGEAPPREPSLTDLERQTAPRVEVEPAISATTEANALLSVTAAEEASEGPLASFSKIAAPLLAGLTLLFVILLILTLLARARR